MRCRKDRVAMIKGLEGFEEASWICEIDVSMSCTSLTIGLEEASWICEIHVSTGCTSLTRGEQ